MTARKNLTQLSHASQKIRASKLMDRLVNQNLSKCTITPSQVCAAWLVLRKALPDLKPIKVEYEAAPGYVDVIREANSQHEILDRDA
jgi:hypothetical protein